MNMVIDIKENFKTIKMAEYALAMLSKRSTTNAAATVKTWKQRLG